MDGHKKIYIQYQYGILEEVQGGLCRCPRLFMFRHVISLGIIGQLQQLYLTKEQTNRLQHSSAQHSTAQHSFINEYNKLLTTLLMTLLMTFTCICNQISDKWRVAHRCHLFAYINSMWFRIIFILSIHAKSLSFFLYKPLTSSSKCHRIFNVFIFVVEWFVFVKKSPVISDVQFFSKQQFPRTKK